MSDNTDNTDKASIPGRSAALEAFLATEYRYAAEIEPSIESYARTYRIMRILSNAAAREAEKVSCRPGCYGAKQKFEETLDEMLSCDFKSDNEEDDVDNKNNDNEKKEEEDEDINVVVEKTNDEKVDLDEDRVTDSGEIDASGNKIHTYSFALRPQGSESQKDQIAKLHKPFKKNK